MMKGGFEVRDPLPGAGGDHTQASNIRFELAPHFGRLAKWHFIDRVLCGHRYDPAQMRSSYRPTRATAPDVPTRHPRDTWRTRQLLRFLICIHITQPYLLYFVNIY